MEENNLDVSNNSNEYILKSLYQLLQNNSFIIHGNMPDNKILAHIFFAYGRYLSIHPNINIPKAFYFYKLSAELGGLSDAQFYVSLFSQYNLDGKMQIKHNLYYPNSEILEHKSKLGRLANYFDSGGKHSQKLNLYFSSLQGNTKSQLAFAFSYMVGLNYNKNCSSSAFYYLEVVKKVFLQNIEINQENYIPKIIERKKISLQEVRELKNNKIFSFLWGSNKYSFKNEYQEELSLVQYKASHQNVQAILQLAYFYFYGMKGLKRNYEKSIQLFQLAIKLEDNASAKSSLGFMHLKGLGTLQNVDKAYDLFQQSAKKNESRALNGLGFIHSQKSFEKYYNLTKSVEYFNSYFIYKIIYIFKQESATLGNSEGQYNLGALYLLDQNIQNFSKDIEKAKSYFSLAAAQGHPLSMINMALLHLDGTYAYLSCELAIELLRSTSNLGPWSQKLKSGYFYYKQGNLVAAVMEFLELAYLGEQTAQINAALILEYISIFNGLVNYDNLLNELQKDIIYQQIMKKQIQNEIINLDPHQFVFSDIYYLIDHDDIKVKEKLFRVIISQSHQFQSNTFSLSQTIAYQLYYRAALQKDSMSRLKVGDMNYYGRGTFQDFKSSSLHYEKVLTYEKDDEFTNLANFNLGYMHLIGKGVEINMEKSFNYFNKSAHALLEEGDIQFSQDQIENLITVSQKIFIQKSSLKAFLIFYEICLGRIQKILNQNNKSLQKIKIFIFFLFIITIICFRVRIYNIQNQLHQYQDIF